MFFFNVFCRFRFYLKLSRYNIRKSLHPNSGLEETLALVTHSHTHTHAHKHAHTHTHTYTLTHTHTHTHTDTRTTDAATRASSP